MKKKSSLKKLIRIFLALHTATAVLFACLILRGGVLPDGLLAAISLVGFSILLTAYTAHKIHRAASQEVAVAMDAVCCLSDQLKAMSEKVYDDAKTVERSAVLINTYVKTAAGLLNGIDLSDAADSRETDS